MESFISQKDEDKDQDTFMEDVDTIGLSTPCKSTINKDAPISFTKCNSGVTKMEGIIYTSPLFPSNHLKDPVIISQTQSMTTPTSKEDVIIGNFNRMQINDPNDTVIPENSIN